MVRAQRNLAGLTEDFQGMKVHENYLKGLEPDEFASGLRSLAEVLKALYLGMISNPQEYAIKGADDVQGLVKHTNFLLLLAHKGEVAGDSLVIDGRIFAAALKDAKVTKPEIYFGFLEPLGFVVMGLGKKIEASEKIAVEFPDNQYLLTALKAMADAVAAFSKINPRQGNHYFELLDHRILESDPAYEPKPTMDYIISKLNDESRYIVAELYELVRPYAKCEIKGSLQWYWTPTFTLKSTKRVIMSFKLDLVSHSVKLNLAHIGRYVGALVDLPKKMAETIRDGGWECGNCNAKCEGGFAFQLEGTSYRKCRAGSFVFDNPRKDEYPFLSGLLRKELSIAAEA